MTAPYPPTAGPVRRVWCLCRDRPMRTVIPIGMVPLGVTAMVLGSHASKAFDNFGGAALVRGLGAAMLIGGVMFIVGIVREDAALEPLGLTSAAAGCLVYGIGVLVGLHTQGILAGGFVILVAVAFLGQIRKLIRETRPGE